MSQSTRVVLLVLDAPFLRDSCSGQANNEGGAGGGKRLSSGGRGAGGAEENPKCGGVYKGRCIRSAARVDALDAPVGRALENDAAPAPVLLPGLPLPPTGVLLLLVVVLLLLLLLLLLLPFVRISITLIPISTDSGSSSSSATVGPHASWYARSGHWMLGPMTPSADAQTTRQSPGRCLRRVGVR